MASAGSLPIVQRGHNPVPPRACPCVVLESSELNPGNVRDVLVPHEPVEEVSVGHCLSLSVPRCSPHVAGGSWGGPRTITQFISASLLRSSSCPFDGTLVRMRG